MLDAGRHSGEAVAQAVELVADRREDAARGVQAEKPDPRLAADTDVRAQVQLGDRTERRPRRRLSAKHAKEDEHEKSDDIVAQHGRDDVPRLASHCARTGQQRFPAEPGIGTENDARMGPSSPDLTYDAFDLFA